MSNLLNWTTLPAGIRWSLPAAQIGVLKIGLVVSPRLDLQGQAAGKLSDESFADFLHWPNVLKNARYTLRIRQGVAPINGETDFFVTDVTPVADANHAADDRFWSTIFDPSTIVMPYDAPNRPAAVNPIASYDAAMLHDAVSAGYAVQLNAFKDAIGQTSDGVGNNPLVRILVKSEQIRRRLVGPSLTGPEETSIANAFARFSAFHQRDDSPQALAAAAAAEQGKLDIHSLISALQDHNTLLRKLGLAWDFELPLSQQQIQSLGPSGRLRIEVSGLGLSKPATSAIPWTAFEVSSRIGNTAYGIFHPARQNAGQTPDWAGFRSLSGTAAKVTPHELDASALNLLALALHVTESEQAGFDYTAIPDAPKHLPALRHGGLALIDLPNNQNPLAPAQALPVEQDILDAEGRHQSLETKLASAAVAAVGQPLLDDEVLFVEDGLVRGYRVDVFDEGGSAWRSLCERVPSYTFTGLPLRGTPLEHWHPGTDEGEVAKVVTQQATSVQKRCVSPFLWNWNGWSLVIPRPGKPQNPDGSAGAIPPSNVHNFTFNLSVPDHSIPKKRFGRSYEFRARSVDLAGNSWSPEEATLLLGSGKLAIEVAGMTDLRSEPVRSPMLIQDYEGLDGEKGDFLVLRQLDTGHSGPSTRHVVPPDAPELLVEEHGSLDLFSDKQTYDLFKEASGKFPDSPHESWAPYKTATGRLKTPYLPDPMARAVMLRDVTAGQLTAPVTFPALPSSNPAVKATLVESIILQLRPGKRGDAPSVKVNGADIVVTMPPGERYAGHFSTSVGDNQFNELWVSQVGSNPSAILSTFGLAQQWRGVADGHALTASLRSSLARGEEPVVTPSRPVTFIYATQRPLDAPQFGKNARVTRTVDTPSAVLVDEDFQLHIGSTGRVEFTASWQDIVDIPGKADWQTSAGKLAPFGYNLSETDGTALGVEGVPASYWQDDPRAGQSAVKQKRKDETKRRQSSTAHVFPDTKYREVTYTARAISRFGAFMPVKIREDIDALSRTTPKKLVVLSSAPPAIPVVRYILPTFASKTSGATRDHVGGGFRILLERGWFSSGVGEKLAVVLYPTDLSSAPTEISKFVTEWGFNPRKLGGGLSIRPTIEDFSAPGGILIDQTMTLYSGEKPDPDLGGTVPAPITASFSLITYDVAIDNGRDALYCDINLNPHRAYFPCVRLALARYQENSLDGVSLSPVVLADFVQLSPARSVTITSLGAGKRKVTVTGISYVDVEFDLLTSVMEVVIQRRRASAPGGQPIWEAAAGPATVLQSRRIGGEAMSWTGQIAEPSEGNWRVVITEYEYYAVDPTSQTRPGENVAANGKSAGRRIIFSDTIEF